MFCARTDADSFQRRHQGLQVGRERALQIDRGDAQLGDDNRKTRRFTNMAELVGEEAEAVDDTAVGIKEDAEVAVGGDGGGRVLGATSWRRGRAADAEPTHGQAPRPPRASTQADAAIATMRRGTRREES